MIYRNAETPATQQQQNNAATAASIRKIRVDTPEETSKNRNIKKV